MPFIRLLLCLGLFSLHCVQAWAQEPLTFPVPTPNSQNPNSLPLYQIHAHYDAALKTIKGILVLHAPAQTTKSEWTFILPMNRLQSKDPRGFRRVLEPPVFAQRNPSAQALEDPLYDDGFEPGGIKILSITDENGTPFPHKLKKNPNWPVGYSIKDGILKVSTATSQASSMILTFESTLPGRTRDGVVRTEMVAENWFPRLIQDDTNTEQLGGFEPAPAFFEVWWSSTIAGKLVSSIEHVPETTPQERVYLGKTEKPLKTFPLAFSPNYQEQPVLKTPTVQIHSIHFPKAERRAKVLQEWMATYFKFMKQEYGLALPWKEIYVVETWGDFEDVHVVNNIIFVPEPHYERGPFMDRRVAAFLTQGLARLWFSEHVWLNTDTDQWMKRGFSAFFGMKFFERQYGVDAGVFDFIDWLNPKYKEHFMENMVRNIRPDLRIPVMTPAQRLIKNQTGRNITTDESNALARFLTYQVALIFNMLEHLIGAEAFQSALQEFLQTYQYQVATLKDLQVLMEKYSEQSLEWFFQQWFYGSGELDYAVGNIDVTELPGGTYKTEVEVLQLAEFEMPVDVRLILDDGSYLEKRTSRKGKREVVTFLSDIEPDEVSLDPDEYLVEIARVNNHSFYYFRVRFAFDWKKQREVMINVLPIVGDDAFDGKQIGVAARYNIDEFYKLNVASGYGTKSEEPLYQITLERNRLWTRNLSFTLDFSRMGGVVTRGVKLDYAIPQRREKLAYGVAIEANQEEVFDVSRNEETADESEHDTGDTSNMNLSFRGSIGFKNFYFPIWNIHIEQPLADFGAEFQYTLISARLSHVFNLGFRRRLQWTWIYGTVHGNAPIQKQHQLGNPKVLRGYPNRTVLRDDNMVAMRTTYQFPLVVTSWWGNVSSLGFQGLLFYDRGRAWGNDESFEAVRTRQNVGVGIQWRVDAVALLQLPLRIEIAYPLDDPEFNSPQLVLLGFLSFF